MLQISSPTGGGIGKGNTCKSMADSCQCMAKTTTILKKKKKKKKIKIIDSVGKKKISSPGVERNVGPLSAFLSPGIPKVRPP